MVHPSRFCKQLVLLAACIVLPGVPSMSFAQVGPPNGNSNGPGNQQPPNNQEKIPEIDTSKVTEARRDLADAQAIYAKAQRNLSTLRKKLEAEAAALPEVVSATEAVAAARKVLEAASAPVLAALGEKAEYKSADAALTAARLQLDAINKAEKINAADQEKALQVVSTARELVSKMKSDALAGSAEVVDAQAKLKDAAATLATVKAKAFNFDTNEEFNTAKSELDEAKTKVKAAQDELTDAQKDLERQKKERAEAIERQKSSKNNRNNSGGTPGTNGGSTPPGR